MNNMKRIISVLTVLVMMAALLCGCGTGGTSETTEPSTTAAPETTTAPETTAQTDAPVVDNGKTTYTVTVTDAEGNGIAGVAVQFCDEANCMLPVSTDENGVACGSYATGEYHATIVSVPEGYVLDSTAYYFDGATELVIVLQQVSE